MKKLITLITLISLSGCMYQSVTAVDIANAQAICGKYNEKVITITSGFEGLETVTCSDLNKYTINAENLPKVR